MSERRGIFSLSFRVAAALVAAVGLGLLFVPGVARGLGRPSEAAPWTLTRPEDPTVPRSLLRESGLDVTPSELRDNRRAWSDMNETERADLVKRFGRLQQMSGDERAQLVERYGELRKKSRDERIALRRQAERLAKFEASLSREDLAELDSLTGSRRAAHLVRLWRASRGLD